METFFGLAGRACWTPLELPRKAKSTKYAVVAAQASCRSDMRTCPALLFVSLSPHCRLYTSTPACQISLQLYNLGDPRTPVSPYHPN